MLFSKEKGKLREEEHYIFLKRLMYNVLETNASKLFMFLLAEKS